jgi:hypothetical protein
VSVKAGSFVLDIHVTNLIHFQPGILCLTTNKPVPPTSLYPGERGTTNVA